MKKPAFYFMLVLAVVSCSKNENANVQKAKIEVVDYAERLVTLEEPAKKIVVMADNAFAVVKQLDAIDMVIGIDNKTKGYLPLSIVSHTNPEVLDLPDVGKTKSPNFEYIISLAPDLVLLKGNKEQADTLEEKTGIPAASIISIDGYDMEIYTKIGALLGKDAKAKKVVSLLERKKNEIEERLSVVSEENRKSAYIIVQNSKKSLFRTIKSSQALELAGVNSAAINAQNVNQWGFADLSEEEMLRISPDYVYFDVPTSDDSITIDDIKSNETLQFVEAVKQGRVYKTHTFALPKDYIYVVAEAYYYANIAYPEIITAEVYKKAIDEIFEIGYGIKNYYDAWEESLL
ncbi:MAG TPA: ABC transporter substrate-binding protein [Spirochaetota bacterium]|nr:ABC transporter substrate-binding protein [Spirochaetota bacterium]HOS32291.1 ABC transporter substrate-binding protein [Spirochaetota bacterium]HOS54695.1 ABC transporter substrate-binding protein [Spirochaetota bacterium]HQF77285.1 ABC transporter substrate-binding protein [Spirochaetota bacterium]HQH29361.1 ABC transporter substrate-binding protein [Spirochaetota bacterium]